MSAAISRNLPNQVGRGYSNLYGISCDQFRFDEGERYYRDGVAYRGEQQHDLDRHSHFPRAARHPLVLEHRGRWDEAVAIKPTPSCSRKALSAPLHQIFASQANIGVIHGAPRRAGRLGGALDSARSPARGTDRRPQYVISGLGSTRAEGIPDRRPG